MKKIIVVSLLVAIAPFNVLSNEFLAQESPLINLNGFYALVDDLYQKDILDGEVLVAQGDIILFHRQSQYIEASSVCNPQFRIASVSKQFTAVALLRALYDSSSELDEALKFDYVVQELQKPLITFLPPERFAWGTTVPEWAYQISLQHLLSHTSGMVQHVRLMFERDGYEAVNCFFRKSHSSAEIMQRFGQEPLEFTPGSAYSYSNLGYELLAEVISIIANMPFSEYLQQHIFGPNNMDSTCNPVQGSSHGLKRVSSCFRVLPEMFFDSTTEAQKPFMPEPDTLGNIGNSQGSGGIISTARDLWQWNRSLHEFKSVLPRPLYELLVQPKLEYNKHAYGIWNRNGIMHSTGKSGAYTAQLIYISQDDISIIVLCHIDYDELIEYKKIKELESQLSLTIEDKNELQKHVNEIMNKEHSSKRGSAQLFEYLHKLVDSFDPS